ncbi:MAG: O-succinylhomoserine sulfhydrylase [Oceanococcaceae bacterium]
MSQATLHPRTLGVRAEDWRSREIGEHSAALYLTSSFAFESAEQAAARFSGAEPGCIYSRFTNPTVEAFERRLAAMEGGTHCVATASGMAAVMTICFALLDAGDRLVASHGLFGSTTGFLLNHLARFGVEVVLVDGGDLAAWEQACAANTRMFLVESPTNPLCDVIDIRALAAIARARDVLFVVDNCFCTPALQRPLELGADLVVHSATKFLDGQGRCVGGAIVGDAEQVGGKVYNFMRSAGPCLSPFNAWVFLKGLETLDVRMQAHSASAQQLALWLEQHPAVSRVYYTGLPSHPQHALAASQQSAHGGIVAFDVHGGQDAAFAVINTVELMTITANLGDTRTTITHPASTTHHRIGPEARAAAGIGDGLVRLSIGLEHPDDLQNDLAQALGRLGHG